MKRITIIAAMAVLAIGCGDDTSEPGGADAYNGWSFTVTGPAAPEGLDYEIPAEDANPFIGVSDVSVLGTSLMLPATNQPDAELRSLTLTLDGQEARTYGDNEGEMSLYIVLPEMGTDITIGSDGEYTGEFVVSEVSDDRFAGTIDIVLNDTTVNSTDQYTVVGAFDVRD